MKLNLDQEKIATAIRIDRERTKMTQEELARKLGKSQQAVAKWENGSIPRIKIRKQLATIFGPDSETAKLLGSIEIFTPQAVKEMTYQEEYSSALELVRRSSEIIRKSEENYAIYKQLTDHKIEEYEKEIERLKFLLKQCEDK